MFFFYYLGFYIYNFRRITQMAKSVISINERREARYTGSNLLKLVRFGAFQTKP